MWGVAVLAEVDGEIFCSGRALAVERRHVARLVGAISLGGRPDKWCGCVLDRVGRKRAAYGSAATRFLSGNIQVVYVAAPLSQTGSVRCIDCWE